MPKIIIPPEDVQVVDPKDQIHTEQLPDGSFRFELKFSIVRFFLIPLAGGMYIELEPDALRPKVGFDLASAKMVKGVIHYMGHFGDPRKIVSASQHMIKAVHISESGFWCFDDEPSPSA
jgi:hypothetical protein